jgi:hypothetical protein
MDYKPKSIIIDGELHHKFKVFCKGKNLKIGGVAENLITLYMDRNLEIRKLLEMQKINE